MSHLVLTRRISESLMIGNDIKLTVSGVKGNQVRLSIDAPREIDVYRQEVYDKIQNKNNIHLLGE